MIQVIGDSSISVIKASLIDVKGLILNNVPTNISIADCNINIAKSNYILNVKQTTPENSSVHIRNSSFKDEAGVNTGGNYP